MGTVGDMVLSDTVVTIAGAIEIVLMMSSVCVASLGMVVMHGINFLGDSVLTVVTCGLIVDMIGLLILASMCVVIVFGASVVLVLSDSNARIGHVVWLWLRAVLSFAFHVAVVVCCELTVATRSHDLRGTICDAATNSGRAPTPPRADALAAARRGSLPRRQVRSQRPNIVPHPNAWHLEPSLRAAARRRTLGSPPRRQDAAATLP